MAYRITLVDSIAKLGNWHGTRRRTCTFADGHTETIVFGRRPVVLAELPPEVKNDPKLEVEETDAPVTPLPVAVLQAPDLDAFERPSDPELAAAPSPLALIPEHYLELDLDPLRELAAGLGLDTTGNRYQVRNRITELVESLKAPVAAEAEVA